MGRFTQLAFFPLLALAALVPAAAFGKVCRHSLCRSKPAVVTYAYDHRGRMVCKEISHRGTEARRIEYLWDDWNIIRETITNLSTFQPFNHSTDYVWGLDLDGSLQGTGGVGGLLAVIRDDGVFLPTYDANGNISEYVSTNGEVVAHYDYSPFGEPLVTSGELASSFTDQFSTKPYCPVTGFSEYQMRKYRSEIGRWMSRDPIDETEGLNLFEFCLNGSTFRSDKKGESIIAGGIIGVGGTIIGIGLSLVAIWDCHRCPSIPYAFEYSVVEPGCLRVCKRPSDGRVAFIYGKCLQHRVLKCENTGFMGTARWLPLIPDGWTNDYCWVPPCDPGWEEIGIH